MSSGATTTSAAAGGQKPASIPETRPWTSASLQRDGYITAKYSGEFSDGKLREGNGRLDWPNGDFYEGGFKDGLRSGQGRYVREGGKHVYEGGWHFGKPHGHGVETWPNGSKYDGTYHKGLFHGIGVHITPVGKYDGQWQNGLKHGRGTMEWNAGKRRYEGKWQEGKMHGRGFYVRADKGTYDGYWIGGMRHGSGIETDPNGEKYVGRHAYNKRHGRGTLRLQTGHTREGEWDRGKLKEWVAGQKLGAMTIPKELLDSTLAADLTMMASEGT